MDIITPLFPQHVSYHYLRHTSQGLYNFPPEFEVNLLLRQILGKQSGNADFPLADMVQLLGKMPHRPLCPPTLRHPPHLQMPAFFQSQIQLQAMIVCQQAGMLGRVPPATFEHGGDITFPLPLLSRTLTKQLAHFVFTACNNRFNVIKLENGVNRH